MNRRTLMLLGASLPFLASCGPSGPKKSLRYRLKAYVTVEGRKYTGSTVLETVWTDTAVEGFDMGSRWSGKTWGDAITINLGSQRVLLGLLNSVAGTDPSAGISTRAPERQLIRTLLGATSPREIKYAQDVDDLAQVRGEHEIRESQLWPPFVLFPDIRKLETIELINPAVSPTGKDGVTIDRVTLSITNGPISRGIEKRLPWWGGGQFKSGEVLEHRSHEPLYEQIDRLNFKADGEPK